MNASLKSRADADGRDDAPPPNAKRGHYSVFENRTGGQPVKIWVEDDWAGDEAAV